MKNVEMMVYQEFKEKYTDVNFEEFKKYGLIFENAQAAILKLYDLDFFKKYGLILENVDESYLEQDGRYWKVSNGKYVFYPLEPMVYQELMEKYSEVLPELTLEDFIGYGKTFKNAQVAFLDLYEEEDTNLINKLATCNLKDISSSKETLAEHFVEEDGRYYKLSNGTYAFFSIEDWQKHVGNNK